MNSSPDSDATTTDSGRLEPIAIIGIGCRFPGGVEDPESFWKLLASGTDAIIDIPADRWRTESFYDPDPVTPGRMSVRQGGFLRAPIDRFDAAFFGISPREAASLDPQQRLLLEVTWEAMEDAGIPPSHTAGTRVGAYIGGFTFDAAVLQVAESNRRLIGPSTPTGVSMTMLAARLSYTFDWLGPSLTIDTACSSSLVAFHQACVALSRGECELAVAGGVNVMSNPTTTILLSKGQFLSPDSRCKSFDHRADGYARGEGAGLVLLKPLAAALRDGDRVRAVVRGTAVNQDGRTPGVQMPSAEAQRAVIRAACRAGRVDPASVLYYEAHGTGTAVGDPVEASAIGEVLGSSDRTHLIGSVKSNFGHTEAAAGVAGVIKAALCLDHGVVPPNLHFERPNPGIPFETLPLRVPTELTPFPECGGPRRAGVNSFGVGGTNAHAVLEQSFGAPAADTSHDDGSPRLLTLSARSPEALRALADAYAAMLEKPGAPALHRVCRAAALHREHHPLRMFVVADGPVEAVEKLRSAETAPRRDPREGLAFVFTGMGPQWWGMGRELLQEDPRFAEVVAGCDKVLARFGLSIAEELLRPEEESRLTETLYAQVANFVVQIGLTAIWRDWGIEPTVIVGHSVGEVAAAYVAGVYSLEDALTISVHRASLQARLAGRGAMAAVDQPAAVVQAHLVEGVSIAAINSTNATTVAGDPDALERVTTTLRQAGASVRPLRVEVAYHSHQMDEIREPLLTALAGIRPRTAGIPLFSTVTGDRVDGTGMDAGYWWRNVREPVRFADALRRLLALSPGVIMEIGPHPVLASSIDEATVEQRVDAVRVAAQRRGRPQRRELCEALGVLYTAGVEPDWRRVHPGPREHLDLPRYPWQREHHWVESAASREARLGDGGLRLRGRTVVATSPVRDVELSMAEFPYLADHRIGQTMVFPGSGYLEAALALFPEEEPCVLEDVVFHRPLTLVPQPIATLRSSYDPAQRLITLHSRDEDDAEWTLHAQGRHSGVVRPRQPRRQTATLEQLTRSWPQLDHDEIYRRMDRTELSYGPAFRAVRRMWFRAATGEVYAELDPGTADLTGYRLHPAVLDAALHCMLIGAVATDENASGTYIPSQLAELRFHRVPGRRLWVHGRGRLDAEAGHLDCDVTLFTDDGEVVAELIGMRARALRDDHAGKPAAPEELYYEHAWRPEPARSGTADGTWVVIGSSPAAAGLVQGLRKAGGEVAHVLSPDGDWAERAADPACRGVVYFDDAGSGRPATTGAPACSAVAEPLRLVQNLTAAPLFIVTSGAQSVSADDATTDPFAAALWGFGRVVNAEYPDLRCRLIDLDSTASIDALVVELTSDELEEVALRDGVRHVRRLEHAEARSGLHHIDVTAGRTPVRLVADGSGVSGLGFTATGREAPGPAEVEVEISHAGLNFKDVLKVTGLLTAEAMSGSHSQDALGMECSGTVVRIGEAVSGLKLGDQVFVHGRDLFRSHVTVDAVRVVRAPAGMSPAQAASLFPAVTAYQAVTELARVRPGDRVLVHAGAGGVGLAAVRIARWLGAEVYATAGSEDRRAFLLAEGVAGVADSRSTSFADDILAMTSGEGVDVVINSLSDEFLRRSLDLLRPFGRFVELGKADIAADRLLRLSPFHRGLSFHAFDYDQMMRLRPETAREYMREVAALYEQGAFAPLPVTEVVAGHLPAAFQAMARSEHIGKVVVRVAGETVRVPARSVSAPLVTADGTYVITGGLGGLGLTVARWLADRGARHLVLMGRRGAATDEAKAAVDELCAEGVEVRVERADVADRERVTEVLAQARASMPPLRGIFHTAADFDDALLSEMDATRLVKATGPKADGAWYLHEETQQDELDFFVLFSSIASQLGSAVAGAYSTANEFLNALARYRHALGLPALSVGWGMIEEVGVSVNVSAVENVLRINGHTGVTPAQVVTELETLLRTRAVEGSVAGMDWRKWTHANPQLRRLPRYQSLVPDMAADGDETESVPHLIRSVSPGERAELLPPLVAPLIERVTGLSDEQLRSGQSVDIDSLAGVELRVLLQNELGIAVPAVRLQRNLTLTGLTAMLGDELERESADAGLSPAGITVHDFVSSDGTTVYGHLSLPGGTGPFPAVVVCTSGTGGALDEQGRYAQIGEHAPLLAAGFAVFTVDHRGTPGHGPDHAARAEMGGGDVDDVAAAARYLCGMPEIDPRRLSIVGTSRGAYTATLALARHPEWWHRAVLIMGLYQPAHYFGQAQGGASGLTLPHGAEIDPADLRAYFDDPAKQPLHVVDAVTAPLMLIHGDDDTVAPVGYARELAERAERAGVPAQLVTVAGLGHDNEFAGEPWTDLWRRITEFVAEQ
ncbi:SDR family NAD(P)-dependent oxidoreductase [Amycolatopsis sp. NEAU-NG30]|uniref:SDR family NAD(P)-dependent oxidoreductase n=1 Tax=Amycolatopsis melonis TaxID=3156488 RepID=A0ABV0L803_9PSEU